jgi:hypothetical protein
MAAIVVAVVGLSYAIKAKNTSGRRGLRGVEGEEGDQGVAGTAGATGSTGINGSDGATGATGAAGSTGPAGGGDGGASAPIHVSAAFNQIPDEATLVSPITYIFDGSNGEIRLPANCAEGQQYNIMFRGTTPGGVIVTATNGFVTGYSNSSEAQQFSENYINHANLDSTNGWLQTSTDSSNNRGQYITLEKLAAANEWTIIYSFGFGWTPNI